VEKIVTITNENKFELLDEPQEYLICDVRQAIEDGYDSGLTDYSRMIIKRTDVSGQFIYHTRLRPEFDEDQQILFWVIDE